MILGTYYRREATSTFNFVPLSVFTSVMSVSSLMRAFAPRSNCLIMTDRRTEGVLITLQTSNPHITLIIFRLLSLKSIVL